MHIAAARPYWISKMVYLQSLLSPYCSTKPQVKGTKVLEKTSVFCQSCLCDFNIPMMVGCAAGDTWKSYDTLSKAWPLSNPMWASSEPNGTWRALHQDPGRIVTVPAVLLISLAECGQSETLCSGKVPCTVWEHLCRLLGLYSTSALARTCARR